MQLPNPASSNATDPIASALRPTALLWSHHNGLCAAAGGLGCDNTGRPMDSKLSPAQADPHHDGDVVLLAPKDWTDAEEALSKLAHVASDRRRPAAGSDFSAGPPVTEPSLYATLRPSHLNNEPSPAD